jgi:hypothetical protein
MIYKFRLVSDEAELFARNIEIGSESTFLELHEAIIEAVGYSREQISSFFLSDNDWNIGKQITLLDMSGEDEGDIMQMSETKIGDFLSALGDNLIYVFDFFNDRAFYLTITELSEPKSGVDYPVFSGILGTPPPQTTIDDIGAEIAAMQQELESGDDGYFDNEYDDDDLEDGYSEEEFGSENWGDDDKY